MSKGPKRRSMVARIEEKLVPEGDCLVYQGGRDTFDYGLIWDNDSRTKKRAHRVIFEHYNGPLPDGHVVRHTCDNPPCCNHEHLISGTQQENIQDMVERSRAGSMPGETHPNSKLTETKVLEIRALHAEGKHSYSILADKFCVSPAAIAQVVTRRSWKHI